MPKITKNNKFAKVESEPESETETVQQDERFDIYQSSTPYFIKDNVVICPDCIDVNVPMINRNGIFVCKMHTRFAVSSKAVDTIKSTDAFKRLCFPLCTTCSRCLLNVVTDKNKSTFGKLFFVCRCEENKVFQFCGNNAAIKAIEKNMSDNYLQNWSNQSQPQKEVKYHAKKL
jgi:hypothetical protein